MLLKTIVVVHMSVKERERYGTMQETYHFIINFIKENGYSPSYREIANGTGRTLSTTASRLEKLVKYGMIKMKPESPRTISVVGYQFVKERE